MAVIDASVYVALMNANESHHTNSWAWFQQAQSAQELLSTPVILLAEVAAALSRGMNNPSLAHRVIQQLLRSKVINLVPVSPTLAKRAATIATDHQIRGCDAIYLALAEQLDDYLVTLDQEQLERGSAVVNTHKP
ncbi:MAG: type II toxin-antitoxin system VapC family toxin [Chloroflexi bacterium]|nr:type II toxin-antitoxin system VapC family toxin [Chloroflexota bacterium]